MEDFKRGILSLLAEQEAEKDRQKIVPNYSLLVPLYQSLHDALNELHREGKIKIGPTRNSKYIKLTQNE